MRAHFVLLLVSAVVAPALACAPQTDLSNVPATGATGPLPTGPAGATLVDPPAGATAVPLNLAGVVVRFPAAITWGAGGLVVCGGQPVPVPVSAPTDTPCADGGGGACYQVALAGSLPASVPCAVSIAAGAVDATGTPVAGGTIGVFEDADAPDVTPPVLGDVAVSSAGPCLTVSFTTDEPASGTIVVQAGGAEIDTPAGAGLTSFTVGIPLGSLPPSTAATVTVNATDLAGNATVSAPFAFTTPVALPPLAITEVLANPAGPEPDRNVVAQVSDGPELLPEPGTPFSGERQRDLFPVV